MQFVLISIISLAALGIIGCHERTQLEGSMILGLGGPEILIVLVVVLLIFGPKNLPKLGSALGKTVKNVREGMDGEEDEESTEDDGEDADDDAASQQKSKDAE